MIQEQTRLDVADNTGAKRAMCFRVLGQRKRYARLGDVIRVAIKEATPTGAIKKGQVCTAVLAAYVFARIQFPGRDLIFYLYLATLIIPTQVTMLPLFLIVSRLGWIDTYQAMIVPFLANAFAVFFLNLLECYIKRFYLFFFQKLRKLLHGFVIKHNSSAEKILLLALNLSMIF